MDQNSKNINPGPLPGKVRNRLRGFNILVIWLILLWSIGSPSLGSTIQTTREETSLKAAFLFNFIKFVDWPAESFEGNDSPIIVALLGESPLNSALYRLEGQKIRQHPLVVRRVEPSKGLTKIHVLVVSGHESKDNHQSLISRLAGTPVLTVSDEDEFVERGGVIGLIPFENKLRFDINLGMARRSSLKISAQLLKLARKVIE